MIRQRHFLTGWAKAWIYLRILLHVPWHYRTLLARPRLYTRFLRQALQLLLVFRHNKVVRNGRTWKLHLYLPAYPSTAFFHALESKLLRQPAGPTTVVFSITKACTYACPHCYQRRDAGADLDQELLLRSARAVVDAGVALFDIEGGEPFLRFPRLLSLVRALDARAEIWVNSSGDHVEEGMLRVLREAGVFGFMVSIHTPDASRHDAFTGVPGSYGVACEFLRECRRHGFASAINCVLSEEEIRADGLDRLMDLARELDCDYVQLIHPKPAGNWLGRTEEMQTDPALIAKVRQAHLLYNGRRRPDAPSLAAQVFEEAEKVLGCTAGAVDRFYINAHGEVQPCEFLNVSFGNVRNEPFPDILARMRACLPEPCVDWLCCTQGPAIHEFIRRHGLEQTPVPWPLSRELVTGWTRGRPTPVYRRLGIYRPPATPPPAPP
ncbi:MAG: radical SAM protein [Lentisphaeria bacterium]|nr:radical SAM protein [Lentisphaeria bacterium]